VFVWLLLLLLAGSGCAALIYEIVWLQLLQLVIGSSAVSLGLLLAAYMGGLCIGSALLRRVVSSHRNALRVYACLELGIAAFGLITLFGLPLIGRLYLAGPTSGMAGVISRGILAALCLLPPTLLMGASFPAIARSLETSPKALPRLGFLYSANIAGAVIGSLVSGFYLLRLYDMAVATYVAAVINITIALSAFLLGTKASSKQFSRPVPASLKRAPGVSFVYLAIGLSGLTALGAEVVWTRMLSLLLGATVYTFSIVLAVFLFGLWAGSGIGSFLLGRFRHPRLAFAVCQGLLALAIAWAAFTLTNLLPFWPVDPWLSLNVWFNFDLDIVRCLRVIFPATLLWGASFPLALASASPEGEDPARLSGETYAANTAGSIVGAIAFSLVLIPAIGTRGSQQLLIGLALTAAAIAAASFVWTWKTQAQMPRSRATMILAGAILTTVIVGVGLIATVSDVPWQVIAYGRRVAPILRGTDVTSESEPVFIGEGMNASVVITDRIGQRFFYVSGKSEASSGIIDMRLQRMMGHLPALVHGDPHSVLVVGFGAGVTAGSFVPYPDVKSIVICELESIIPPASNKFFGAQNYNVLDDYRTRIVYDDARHLILTSPEKFDVITTDPIHPWVKGTSTLYSKEYYELVRKHLNPGGVVAQWLPVYESDEETVKTELATFFSVFPNGTVWSNHLNGDGYDLVLLGRADDSPIDVDKIEHRLEQKGYSRVLASLADVQFQSATDLMATYAGRAEELRPMTQGIEINRDLNMRLQYLAGIGLNSVTTSQVYRKILSYRRFPEDLIKGSAEPLDTLRDLLGRPHRTF